MSVMPISSIRSVARKSSASDTTVQIGKPSAWSQVMTTLPEPARSVVTQSRGGVASVLPAARKRLFGQRGGVGVAEHGGEGGVGVDEDAVESGGERGCGQSVQQ